jgi:hypothetical protein
MSDDNHAIENGRGWYANIQELLERFHNYRGAAEAEGWTGPHKDEFGATYFRDENDGATWTCASWKELCEEFDITSETDHNLEQEIHESPLSVLVRDGWRQPGGTPEDGGPEEYEILLSTGGPALRIYGRLNEHSEPDTAELQWQNWFKPWTRCTFADETVLLEYAQHFYFGD